MFHLKRGPWLVNRLAPSENNEVTNWQSRCVRHKLSEWIRLCHGSLGERVQDASASSASRCGSNERGRKFLRFKCGSRPIFSVGKVRSEIAQSDGETVCKMVEIVEDMVAEVLLA
jgi:hypothetical protein